MIIKFHIHYNTSWGQQLFIGGAHSSLGNWKEANAAPMIFRGNGLWEYEIQLEEPIQLDYKYFIKHEDGNMEWEFGDHRTVSSLDSLLINDTWRSNHHNQNVLYTSPFKKAFFTGEDAGSYSETLDSNLTIQINAPQLGKGQQLCVLGNCKELGNWDEKKAVLLCKIDYSTWIVKIHLGEDSQDIEYKYAIYNQKKKSVIGYEAGENRHLKHNPDFTQLVCDEYFDYPDGNWRGAGVALPVFSLKTNNSFGIGEFADLIPMVDWASKTGLKIIQVLPVNDTIATHTWVDSYPYASISVFALHPIYANLKQIGDLKDKTVQIKFDKLQKKLNKLATVDYDAVLSSKSDFFKLKFEEDNVQFLKSKAYKDFLSKNNKWLIPYAVFSYLRDLNGTADFSKWEEHSKITEKNLAALADPEHKDFRHIAIHYYIQFYLDKQLRASTEYARKNNVVLKGDIPIGIYRHSVDAWIAPELYNMDGQSGAPPDAFSTSGQNWGFPTYNWDEMAKDGYSWWKERLSKMSDYFDVFRIDHILGFFRIWEIPWSEVEGTLGRFNPALPLSKEEMNGWGIDFNYDRLCRPFIRDYMINDIFGKSVAKVKSEYLDQIFPGAYNLKSKFDTQRKIKDHFDLKPQQNTEDIVKFKYLMNGLFQLVKDVIFLEAPSSDDTMFNPNIDLFNTYSFRDLDSFQQGQLIELHRHYFFNRHNDFWRERAMEKLPALKSATDMLVCGEDLGMVPDSVPGVMDDLQMLSLAIQRMPNDNSKEFWHPGDTAYLSVCSTSSHDTSTLRQWWEEEPREKIQGFYNSILGHDGEAPFYCEPGVIDQIIEQHLHSPSMLAIFPIQDLLAMNGDLRREFPEEEHINHPEIIPHYWRFRLHLKVEELLNADEFNAHIKGMVIESGRAV